MVMCDEKVFNRNKHTLFITNKIRDVSRFVSSIYCDVDLGDNFGVDTPFLEQHVVTPQLCDNDFGFKRLHIEASAFVLPLIRHEKKCYHLS